MVGRIGRGVSGRAGRRLAAAAYVSPSAGDMLDKVLGSPNRP